MRLIQLALLVLLIVLQYRYWFAENGFTDEQRLTQEIEDLQQQMQAQKATNHRLRARVEDLKAGNDAIEELARQDLGLVKPDETLIIVVDEVE